MPESVTPPAAVTAPARDIFKEQLTSLIKHINNFHDDIITEEGAKTAFILPI
jgi:hypothetical protein